MKECFWDFQPNIQGTVHFRNQRIISHKNCFWNQLEYVWFLSICKQVLLATRSSSDQILYNWCGSKLLLTANFYISIVIFHRFLSSHFLRMDVRLSDIAQINFDSIHFHSHLKFMLLYKYFSCQCKYSVRNGICVKTMCGGKSSLVL